MDRDVLWTQSNLKNAEKKLGKKLYANYEGPKDSPWPSLSYPALSQPSEAPASDSAVQTSLADVNSQEKAAPLPAGHAQSYAQ